PSRPACRRSLARFAPPSPRVAYLAVLPIEVSSGVDRDGQARPPRRYVRSRRGNDLVRRYLWMAALSALRCNPAVRALYARVVARHPDHKAIAVGHAMRKLLHLVWAIWKTGRPFDPNHYPWHAPAHLDGRGGGSGPAAQGQAAGHTPVEPAQPVVTAARTDNVTEAAAPGQGRGVDFAPVKRQLPIARVLDHLGLTPRLRGQGPQRRGPCPIHRGDARGRTFSVHVAENVFQCFAAECGRRGDVIDLWASVNGQSVRDAALELVQT